MRIAVTTPTGNIGSKLTPLLLDAGAEVTLLARDPKKIESLAKRGARVEQGSQADADFVKRATEGADVLFWITPGDMKSADLHAWQTDLARNAAAAVKANGVSRVVVLSSIGAQLPSGTGPITGLHRVEKLLEESGAHVTHLRPAFFMENFFMAVPTIRSMGTIFMPAPASTRMPMVATRDIALVASKRLLDPSWTGRSVMGIHGPADVSFAEAGSIIGEAIGKPVTYVAVTADEARGPMEQMGIHPNVVSLFLEMYDAFGTGRLVQEEPRTPETTTPTTLHQFAAMALKPAVA